LNELDTRQLRDLSDLNARLWAWVENEYHTRKHGGLDDCTPLERWQKDLIHIRPLGSFATKIDELFYHRDTRKVKKDGSISYQGNSYEVPFELCGKDVRLVVDPHIAKPIKVECLRGEFLGMVTPLDQLANINRRRCKPTKKDTVLETPKTFNMVELALENYQNSLKIGAHDE
jgi:putative transposase